MDVFNALAVAISELIAALIHFIFSCLQAVLETFGFSVRIIAEKPRQGESRFAVRRLALAATPLIILLIGFWIAYWFISWRFEANRQNAARTEQLVAVQSQMLAAARDANGRLQIRPNGDLPVDDAWGRPLRVAYEQGLLNDVVTVRSAGVDGDYGTLDDFTATERVMVPKDVVVDAAVDRAVQKLKHAVARDNEADNP